MNKLEKLIAKLCPNGVEYKPLGDVCHYSAERISSSAVDAHSFVCVESLLQERRGRVDAISVPSEGNVIAFNEGDVLVGNIRPYLKKIWLADLDGGTNGDVLVIQRNDKPKLTSKYLYHVLASDDFFKHDMQFAKGAKMPRGDKDAVMKFEIPLPPLPVQDEIVRMLDDMSGLIGELENELVARKQQYEWCRDRMLKQTGCGGFQKIALGELGRVAMCKRILKSQTTASGDVPFYKIGTFGRQPDAYIAQALFDEYKKNYSYPQKGAILLSAAGTIGRTVVFDGTSSYYQDSNIVWLEHDESKVLNAYLYYVYQTNPWKISKGGTIERLYNDNILQTEIVLPPLSEQKKIVAQLEGFDKLCNSVTEGLPGEIALRKRQYEYYRDKLLNFKRAG